MNRFMLYAAVLSLAVRQRWYESKWNPWGMGSRGAQVRAAQAVMEELKKQPPATAMFIRAATGTDPSPPNPPVQ